MWVKGMIREKGGVILAQTLGFFVLKIGVLVSGVYKLVIIKRDVPILLCVISVRKLGI